MTILLFMVAAAGFKAYLPAFWSLPNLFLTRAAAAGSIGLINSVGNLGGFLGPYVIGTVETHDRLVHERHRVPRALGAGLGA